MKQEVLGEAENIKLPEITSNILPARIDTGAKSSAIWISEVHEKDGKLEVTFFGKDDPNYSGDRHSFSEFSKVTIKQSSGYSERRYKVKITVEIRGRKIRAWFTLANRSSLTYPVLIGRNVLRGKFIVDVAHDRTNSDKKLTDKEKSK